MYGLMDTRRVMSEAPTTPDLVELAQRLVDAANPRDLDAAMNFYAPDVVFDISETFGIYEGHTALRGFLVEAGDTDGGGDRLGKRHHLRGGRSARQTT